jgi:hypothetical protein
MSLLKKQIIITDESILAFYRENPNIDIININHVFIDILKKLSTNLTDTLANSVNAKIFSTLNELSANITTIKSDVSKLSMDLVTNITVKLHETKKEYLDSLNLIISNNTLSNYQRIEDVLEKHNSSMISRATAIITELIPNTQETYRKNIETNIQTLSASLYENTVKIIEMLKRSSPEENIKEHMFNIESQINKTLLNIQQPIFAFIQSSEQRTNDNLHTIREKLTAQHAGQETLHLELNEFLNKYKYNSSMKGNVSETELFHVLQKIFPADDVVDCRGETATCDYRVNRFHKHKPTILFENKDYSRSATTEEVCKFTRDLSHQKCHGVFLSQNSNITYKENFQIDITGGIIHVYVCNVKYNLEKIQIAVDIIDHLSQKLVQLSKLTAKDTAIHIQKEDLEELMEDYVEFNRSKTQLVDMVRASTKQTVEKIENLQMNAVKKILVRTGAIQLDDEYRCVFCHSFTGKSKASLGAHTRSCKSNPGRVVNTTSAAASAETSK